MLNHIEYILLILFRNWIYLSI